MSGTGKLSSLVNLNEARAFIKFADAIREGHIPSRGTVFRAGTLDAIEQALQTAMDDKTLRIEVKGSVEKRTQSGGSDVDIIIFTRTISRTEKEQVVEKLKKLHPFLPPSQVKLKRIAIGCVLSVGGAVDLVFADTKEYGRLPVELGELFVNNPAAQNAACVLKVSVGNSWCLKPPAEVPSFILELLVLDTQKREGKKQVFQMEDGSLQLFCNVLQRLCDTPRGGVLNKIQCQWFGLTAGKIDGLCGRHIKAQEAVTLRHHAQVLIHHLCASRIYINGGYTTAVAIERWVRLFPAGGRRLELTTPVGTIPSWMLGDCVDNINNRLYCYIALGNQGYSPETMKTLKECIQECQDLRPKAFEFVEGPFGKYVQFYGPAPLHFLSAFTKKQFGLKLKEANESFRTGDYKVAQERYTALVTENESYGITTELLVLLRNRSIAHAKMHSFDLAAKDAWVVVENHPALYKGYVRLIQAMLGNQDADEALAHIQKYEMILSELKLHTNCVLKYTRRLYRFQNEAQKLLAEPNSIQTDCQFVIPVLSCNEHVKYKNRLIVDKKGRGDFKTLSRAVKATKERGGKWSIVVLGGVYAEEILIEKQRLQIIGDGNNVCIESSAHSERLGSTIRLRGDGTYLDLENISIKNKKIAAGSGSHGVYVAERGVTLSMKHCRVSSRQASCVAAEGAKIEMSKCEMSGLGSGILADSCSCVEATNCYISGCKDMGVEIRTNSTCRLFECTISRCERQGFCMWTGGKSAELELCTIEKCGRLYQTGSVQVDSGRATLRKCRIVNNNGDGIVVETTNNKQQSIFCDCCIISNNKQNGMQIFGGNIYLNECRIHNNIMYGIVCRKNKNNDIPLGQVELAHNVFSGCSQPVWLQMENKSCFDNNVRIKHNKVGIGEHFVASFYASDIGWPFSEKDGKIVQGGTAGAVRQIRRPVVSAQHSRPKNEDFAFTAFDLSSAIALQEQVLANIVGSSLQEQYLANIDLLGKQKYITVARDDGLKIMTKESEMTEDLLKKCSVKDLSKTIGERANGRILYGTLCTEPCKGYVALFTVLADDINNNCGVPLYIYQEIPGVDLLHYRECFPKGMRIGIKEPYLKRLDDGSFGVRIDKAEDIVYKSPKCNWSKCSRVYLCPNDEECEQFRKQLSCLNEKIKEAIQTYYHTDSPKYTNEEYDRMLECKEFLTWKQSLCTVREEKFASERCPRCKSVWYCNKVCRKKDKKYHKSNCVGKK